MSQHGPAAGNAESPLARHAVGVIVSLILASILFSASFHWGSNERLTKLGTLQEVQSKQLDLLLSRVAEADRRAARNEERLVRLETTLYQPRYPHTAERDYSERAAKEQAE